jgi:hypothetical protein
MMMSKMPEVLARTAQISQKRIQAALPQLMTRLQQRQAELKREGKAPK